jgi:transcriptional regulator with XRE-family HTH domain
MSMPAAVPGTTVIRRQLGRRLRRLRERAGKTIADVAAAKLASEVKLWRIETGRVAVKIADARALCWLYGADEATTDTLAALAANTTGQDWWQRIDAGTGQFPGFDLYLGLEAIAARLSLYQPELVPGLLQTEEYARAVQWGSLLDPTAEDVERTVRTRLARQQVLFERPVPPRILAVLSQWALTRPVGGAGVMQRQRAHLHTLAGQEGIELHILPAAAGPHPGFRGGFTLLDFDDPDDPPVAYTETDAGATYIEQPDQVARQRRVLARLLELSVPIEEFPP